MADKKEKKPKAGKGNGIARAMKERKKAEATSRNESYRGLSFEDKLARHKAGGRVHTRLLKEKAEADFNKNLKTKNSEGGR